MGRAQSRAAMRWGVIAVATLSAVAFAVLGAWWLASSLGLLVATLVVDMAQERRGNAKRQHS